MFSLLEVTSQRINWVLLGDPDRVMLIMNIMIWNIRGLGRLSK